jgi:hypothetical protein
VGDLVFKRRGDEVVISRKADRSGYEPTAAQLAQQERFRMATLYGKMVMADPDERALYEEAAAAEAGASAYNLMVADFLRAPSVEAVDVSGYGGETGDEIVVQVSDDFDVASVQVALEDDAGAALEGGEATEDPPESGRWVYTATTAVATGTTVRIAVTALDRPGGAATAEEETTL